MNTLIIKGAKDRTKFLVVIKKLFHLSPKESLVFLNNYLPFTYKTWNNEEYLTGLLKDVAEFEFIPEPPPVPTEEELEYIAANAWYNKLPKEDQRLVDVLISASHPHG